MYPLFLCRTDGIFHQDGTCHYADTARYRCDVGSLFLCTCKFHIADKLALGVSVHADVDNNCALFNHIALDKFAFADGNNQNVCTAGDFSQILCLGVTNGHCAVSLQ